MAKLCPRGKAAAKRKFKVYPSAYANMYASAVCSGKVTPGGKKNRKKAMGGGSMNTRIGLKHGTYKNVPPSQGFTKYVTKEEQKKINEKNQKANKKNTMSGPGPQQQKKQTPQPGKVVFLKHGGKACKLAMKGKGRAYGKNS